MILRFLVPVAVTLFAATFAHAAPPTRQTWQVDGVEREALVAVPESAKEKPAPLIFVFHGHSWKMGPVARHYALEKLWPEAIVVYPQGLPTPGLLSDPKGEKSGWQIQPGQQMDRDLHFFDAMLAGLKKTCQVDDKRIYVTGNSNGGNFTFLLWSLHGDLFAAVGPTSSAGGAMDAQGLHKLVPLPAINIAGEKDATISAKAQSESMAIVRENQQCAAGEPWGPEYCTNYPSKIGAPVVACLHPGGHTIPKETIPLLVKFFQQHARP